MNAIAFSGAIAPLAAASRPRLSRNAVIALAVVILHVGFIWVLQSGLLLRTAELIVPAEVLAQLIDPPAPQAEPAPPAPPQKTTPVVQKKAVAKTRAPAAQQAQPLAITDAAPAPEVAAAAVSAAPPAAAEAAPGPAAPAASPAVQLPSSNADYLQNPKPAYPALSKRLGEQGKVILRVLIGVDGTARKAEIRQSSGFERLDQAALNTVLKWRYVPGKRGGMVEEMWFNVPINFVLE
ncbi:MAG: energy transducer TonB [Polaromonas sp.]